MEFSSEQPTSRLERVRRWLGVFPSRRDARTWSDHREQSEHGAHSEDEALAAEVRDLLERELGATTSTDADAGAYGVPTPVSRARVVEWLKANDFSHFIDNDGDLGGLWRGRVFYFFLFGADAEILQVRGQWHREVAIERLEEVLEACNEWNADRIWPKAYLRVRDNGMVHVVAETATDLERGVTDAQLSQLMFCGLSTGNMLFDALDEMYPDPATVAP